MGLAEAIVEESDRTLAVGYAEEIVQYSRNIKEIVVQLSGYSRSAQTEYYTLVDLKRTIFDAARLVTRSLAFEVEKVDLQVPEGLVVNARTSEIQQVFVNLIKNAVEAVSERHGEAGPGVVRVRAGIHDEQVWASVADNGEGIEDDRKNAIFDPFYTTKPPGRGTGLGLNIVYRIVTKYRGTVSVDSEVGSGTTFDLRFPITEPGSEDPIR
jgi:signal transduction histidine kinase